MSDVDEKKSIDAILDEFDPSSDAGDEPAKAQPLTIWLPVEYKRKYDELQSRTRGRFGKVLKEIVKCAIEKKAG